MTADLRKIHRWAWLFITAAGIVFLIFSILDLDIFNKTTSSAKNKQIQVELKGNKLLINLESSLKSSSSVVYAIDKNGNKMNSIGQLESVGQYTFTVATPLEGILIYDNIKQTELFKLNF